MSMLKIKWMVVALLVVAWTLFPSTILSGTYSKVFESYSPDKQYKVVIYLSKVLSPMSLYKYLKNENYFFVLYDKQGGEIFRPSPFYGISDIAAYDSIEFVPGKGASLFFPTAKGYDSFELPK